MRLCLAGDTMLGRNVGERLREVTPTAIFADEVVDATRAADLSVLNLECAVSDRGEPWPDPFKRFYFRAPPVAVEALRRLGVGCVTLANNHALDYGPAALLDTLGHLRAAGIACVGAGVDERDARAPVVIERAGLRLGIVSVSDHPADFAAGPDRPGVAYANLRHGVPPWLRDSVGATDADAVLVSPHWGPNMVTEPVAHVRAAAETFLEAGASLVAGHSAHVFHGVGHRVLYDLGDFVDDYARHPDLHNELGLLWFVTFDGATPTRVEALPLALDHCHTRLANRHEAEWIRDRLRHACAAMGTAVGEDRRSLTIEWAR